MADTKYKSNITYSGTNYGVGSPNNPREFGENIYWLYTNGGNQILTVPKQIVEMVNKEGKPIDLNVTIIPIEIGSKSVSGTST